MKTELITRGHPLWEKTIAFARNSSWKAGPYLANMMEKDAFQAWERVAVAMDGEKPAGREPPGKGEAGGEKASPEKVLAGLLERVPFRHHRAPAAYLEEMAAVVPMLRKMLSARSSPCSAIAWTSSRT